jgi:hypothetical protein
VFDVEFSYCIEDGLSVKNGCCLLTVFVVFLCYFLIF